MLKSTGLKDWNLVVTSCSIQWRKGKRAKEMNEQEMEHTVSRSVITAIVSIISLSCSLPNYSSKVLILTVAQGIEFL